MQGARIGPALLVDIEEHQGVASPAAMTQTQLGELGLAAFQVVVEVDQDGDHARR